MYKKLTCLVSLVLYSLAVIPPANAMSPGPLSPADSKGRTPLYFALKCNKGHEVVSWIIGQMPEVCHQLYKGKSPLHSAIKFDSHLLVIKELLKFIDINIKDYKNRTPFHAAIHCDLKIAAFLLTYNPDINTREKMSGMTPCHRLGYHLESKEEARGFGSVFLRYNPAFTQDLNGRTPLHYAAARSHSVWLMQLLLKHPEALEIKDKEGKTALYKAVSSAARWGVNEMGIVPEINLKIALMLHFGAQQLPDVLGKTPLDCAREIRVLDVQRNIVGILTGTRPDIMEQARLMLIKERIGGQNIVQALNNARFGIKQRGARQPISEANNV